MSGFDERKDSCENPSATVADLLEKTSREHGGGPVEHFHRSSRSQRVEWSRSSPRVRWRQGTEEGGALRWLDSRRECVGFAAASGDALASLEACRAIAAGVPETPVDACPWNTAAEPLEDIDPTQLPSATEMEAWMLENTPEWAESGWIEAGGTRETWSNGPETVQERVRGRVWALWMSGNDPKPLILAARSWREWLDTEVAETWADRATGPARDTPWPYDAKVVFSPETSASIARALVAVLHRPGSEIGSAVGSGWVVRANTASGSSLLGSAADDAGYGTRERILADGRYVVGDWGGPGNLRRGSFRDLPEPTPVCVEIDPPRVAPPRRSVWVSRVNLHPAGDAWLVELRGRQYPDGAAFRPLWARVGPQRLVQSCLGGIGPARNSHRGTVTPALVFDALLFRGD